MMEGREAIQTDQLYRLFPKFLSSVGKDQVTSIQRSPQDHPPMGAMPEPAQREGDEDIKVPPPCPKAVSPQRDIDIISEPRHEGNMPPSPQLCSRSGVEKRSVKIVHQAKTHHWGRTNGNIGITGKITEHLKPKEDGRDD